MSTEPRKVGKRYSRRGFLGRVGVGAGAVAVGPAGALVGTAAGAPADHLPPRQSPLNFGRMFSDRLPSFAEPTDSVKRALIEIGAINGPMDAKDNLAAGPVNLIVDETLQQRNRNNANHTAGTTFVGQFLDHDVTFDAVSRLGIVTEPNQTRNARVPTLDLDSVYGGGPSVSPQLYDSRDRAKLRIESGGKFEDLPRQSNGSAIIADPRNDENVVISGLQAAFIKFHNRMVDKVRADRLVHDTRDTNAVFSAARNQTRWHYQTMLLQEFLPQVVGQSMVDNVLRFGGRFYRPGTGEAFMPVEFQTGVWRIGHSMVRPSYRINFTGQPANKPNAPQFFGFIFDPAQENVPDSEDMRGGSRAARRFIGWPTFFDFGVQPSLGNNPVRPNKILDTIISSALFRLPLFTIASGDPPISLPERNLLRHLTWSLPSGQTIAKVMDVSSLSASEISETGIGSIKRDFLFSTPLWFYVLHEALKREGGLRLGPVGGRIAAEVIIGLLRADGSSVMRQDRFRPIIPVSGSKLRMVDILTFAEVTGVR
jgi:Animal haem peroxidase